jgi:hypothetical protein
MPRIRRARCLALLAALTSVAWLVQAAQVAHGAGPPASPARGKLARSGGKRWESVHDVVRAVSPGCRSDLQRSHHIRSCCLGSHHTAIGEGECSATAWRVWSLPMLTLRHWSLLQEIRSATKRFLEERSKVRTKGGLQHTQ